MQLETVLVLCLAVLAHGCCSPGNSCDDEFVKSCVGAFDPFCVETQWDQQCAEEAQLACSLSCAAPKCQQTAIAFSGGGWRAQISFSGLVSGFLNVLDLHDTSTPGKNLASLFKDVSAVASNSGGTWFSTALLFSQNYARILTECAAAPSQATDIFDALFSNFTNVIDILTDQAPEGDNEALDVVVALVASWLNASDFNEEFGGVAHVMEETAPWNDMIRLLLNLRFTWYDFVNTWLQSCFDGDYAPMEAISNLPTWAAGKEWMPRTSIAAPPSKLRFANIYVTTAAQEDPDDVAGDTVKYAREGEADISEVPANFRTVLGGGYSAFVSPLLMNPDSTLTPIDLTYTQSSASTLTRPGGKTLSTAEFDGVPGTGDGTAFTAPISWVAASSSNAAGAILYDNYFDFKLKQAFRVGEAKYTDAYAYFRQIFNAVAIRARSHENLLTAFVQGTDLPSETAQDAAGQFIFFDGGYTDNTGITSLIAAGHTEITAVIGFGSFGVVPFNEQASNGGISVFMQGFERPANSQTPIFAEDQAWFNDKTEQFDLLMSPFTPPDKDEVIGAVPVCVGPDCHLWYIAHGSVTATTVDNPYYNIEGGKKVLLNLIYVVSNYADVQPIWDSYSKLQQEIVDVMTKPSNKDEVLKMAAYFRR